MKNECKQRRKGRGEGQMLPCLLVVPFLPRAKERKNGLLE